MAAAEVLTNNFPIHSITIDIISSKSRENSYFKGKLLEKIFSNRGHHRQLQIRHEDMSSLVSWNEVRASNVVFLVLNLEDFIKIYTDMTSKNFKFNGYYVIVLLNHRFQRKNHIFKLLWKLQVYNVVLIFEVGAVVKIKTFTPFTQFSCNDTRSVDVKENLFLDKLKNLQGCTIRASFANFSTPFMPDEFQSKVNFKSGDNNLVETLAKSLNFKVKYMIAENQGYIFENGTSEGPLRFLLDGEADFSLDNWWLKKYRLDYLEASIIINYDQIMFIIPPGRELTTFEQLAYPFTTFVWILTVAVFIAGFLVISIFKFKSKAAQNFVFGVNVGNPYLNMIIGFIGGPLKILPKTNFARFILMMFLMYSMVMRTVYQGSFVQLLQSNLKQKEVQTFVEMVEKEFEFVIYAPNKDFFKGTELASKMR